MGGAGYELQARFSSLHNYKGKEWGEAEKDEEEKKGVNKDRSHTLRRDMVFWMGHIRGREPKCGVIKEGWRRCPCNDTAR